MGFTLQDRIDELREDPQDNERLDVEALLAAAGFSRKSYPEISTDVWRHPECGLKVTLDTKRRSLPVPYLQDILLDIQHQIDRGAIR